MELGPPVWKPGPQEVGRKYFLKDREAPRIPEVFDFTLAVLQTRESRTVACELPSISQ
jgi:hypothetical protein